jgi:hypothetical protein
MFKQHTVPEYFFAKFAVLLRPFSKQEYLLVKKIIEKITRKTINIRVQPRIIRPNGDVSRISCVKQENGMWECFHK